MSRSFNIGEYVDEEISTFKNLQITQKNNLDILKRENDRMINKEKNMDTKISNTKRILLLSQS